MKNIGPKNCTNLKDADDLEGEEHRTEEESPGDGGETGAHHGHPVHRAVLVDLGRRAQKRGGGEKAGKD